MKRSYRSLIAVVAAILSFGLFLTACSDDDVASTGANGDEAEQDHDDHGETPVAEGARRIDVNATSFAYDPDEITVDTGEDVAIVLTSDDLLHDFVIDELDVHVAADRDETAEGGLRADTAGEYTYYCTVAGHREAGMEGTLVVEES
ncbi:MAG: cupredoxin domain-containing protein [Candidatus Microthrix subdominans]|uniref:cupredoxin domain-containing protein n=1 Tax=Candidatus Neomicrothrix sp. TaxID=2719034 RepID=UPI001B40319A|nr:cupredoxin domain-containing protein [Candidatus Microthrix sp.]MBK6311707.1 cupredoxin domain-containing protein [Candidatus Microthrix sp.]MBK6437914.1 cupredoxin domain-containing protein [Candidatus Microthrix sp.]MBK7164313.1 cupredoxin domain-containing protein [Candidatus Microthrix sp.]MBK9560618.1 cupredoxin domain-containing protein [Candidatus Microthrix sp.]MBP7406154.1 cupredoxin domain-containing protein [Candidatus Microthrix sp.]